jgi:hypothetical protein
LQSFIVKDGIIRSHYQQTAVGHSVPSADGMTIYTAQGMFTRECRDIPPTRPSSRLTKYFIPSVQGSYYLSIPCRDRFPQQRKYGIDVTVHLGRETRTVATLTDIDYPCVDPWKQELFPNDRRYFWIPDAKLIVTLPSLDKLALYRFDVEAALAKSGLAYFVVDSRPANRAAAGKTFKHAVVGKSSAGAVKYRIDNGPNGMKIDAAGAITWNVPGDHPAETVEATVVARDQSGQEIRHPLRIPVLSRKR